MSPTEEQRAEPGVGLRLILGLGNPGDRYAGTRHNRGRDVVTEWARRRSMEWSSEICGSRVARDGNLILAIPQTYMNRSGHAARCLVDHFELDLERLLVLYDDVSLPLGALRLRPSGGPGGQRGMASVIESLRSDRIPRLRLGILPESDVADCPNLADFVLAAFGDEELADAEEQVDRAVEACETWFEHGTETTMNRFNSKPLPVVTTAAGERKTE